MQPQVSLPVHFTYPLRNGEYRIACMPDVTNFTMSPHYPIYQRSGEREAVTCQMCKNTPIFKGVQGGQEK